MKYLLPCPACGTKIPVETGQAGQVISCQCGGQLEVPTIRGLQKLETVADTHAAKKQWSARQGMFFLGSAIFLGAALWAGYLIALRPTPMDPSSLAKTIDPAAIRNEIGALSPATCYARLAGMTFASPTTFAEEFKTNAPVTLLPSSSLLLSLEDESLRQLTPNAATTFLKDIYKQAGADNTRRQKPEDTNDILWVAGALAIVGILLAASALLMRGNSAPRRGPGRPMEVRQVKYARFCRYCK